MNWVTRSATRIRDIDTLDSARAPVHYSWLTKNVLEQVRNGLAGFLVKIDFLA